MGPGFEGRGAQGMLFHGIALSDAEKARVKEIHAKYKAEGKPIREALRPAMQEARAARQKGDTAAARAAFERTKADRDKMKTLMERERTEIRSALTPANQQKFDANVQELAKRREEWEKNGGKEGHGMRGVKRGQNG
jgi:Spy/CpxP family protein refolding chaperone